MTSSKQKAPFDDLAYASGRWEIYRQDAGMGEHDYCVLRNDEFFCRTEHLDVAKDICAAYDKNRSRPTPPADALDELEVYAKKSDNHLLQNCVRICKEYRESLRREGEMK